MVVKQLLHPGLALTFDDDFAASWLAAADMLADYQARVTFFITRPDLLNAAQVDALRQLRDRGHSIGCHGWRHRRAAEAVATDGATAYLQAEIEPALAHLRNLGFTPSSFAYPCSNRDEVTDAALLRSFRHLRSGLSPESGRSPAQLDEIFCPLSEVGQRGCLFGLGIDNGKWSAAELAAACERASRQPALLVLYAHNISAGGPPHHITPEALAQLLEAAQTGGLRFYGFDELP